VKDAGRNYEKPWAVPKAPKKEKADTYMEHIYPDGVGPDVELINMIESQLLDKNPNVNFDDIADLQETKKLL
jgi:hypothetical protein